MKKILLISAILLVSICFTSQKTIGQNICYNQFITETGDTLSNAWVSNVPDYASNFLKVVTDTAAPMYLKYYISQKHFIDGYKPLKFEWITAKTPYFMNPDTLNAIATRTLELKCDSVVPLY